MRKSPDFLAIPCNSQMQMIPVFSDTAPFNSNKKIAQPTNLACVLFVRVLTYCD